MIAQSWLANRERVTPFLSFPPELRRIVYTTNQIEALSSKLRIAVRTRRHFLDPDAARKLNYLHHRQHQTTATAKPLLGRRHLHLAIHYPAGITI